MVFDVHVGNGMIETIELGRGQSITKAIDVVADKYGIIFYLFQVLMKIRRENFYR